MKLNEAKLRNRLNKENKEKAIIHIYNQYGGVDYSLLSEFLGVTEKTLTSSQGVYKC